MAVRDFKVVQFHRTSYFAISKSLQKTAVLNCIVLVFVSCAGLPQRMRTDRFEFYARENLILIVFGISQKT
jgi:hypothetical protein